MFLFWFTKLVNEIAQMDISKTSRSFRGLTQVLCISLTLLRPSPAHASGDLFYFSASDDNKHYELTLIGREDPGFIQLQWYDLAPKALPPDAYDLQMDRLHKRLVLHFTNKNDPTLPPSFTIKVKGDTGTLEFNGRKMSGSAAWEIP